MRYRQNIFLIRFDHLEGFRSEDTKWDSNRYRDSRACIETGTNGFKKPQVLWRGVELLVVAAAQAGQVDTGIRSSEKSIGFIWRESNEPEEHNGDK